MDARGFVEYMTKVWEISSTPTEEGGVLLTANEVYNRDHDAVQTAKRLGMIRTGTTLVSGEHWGVYRFPNDNGPGVAINADGSACRLGKRRLREESYAKP